MREHYGSFIPGLLGKNITPRDVAPFFAAISSAIDVWEPRFKVTALQPVKVTRDGRLHIFIEGEYRPRALYGDTTAEGARRVDLYASDAGIRIEERASQ